MPDRLDQVRVELGDEIELPDLDALNRELTSRSLHEFVKLMWPVLEPGRSFVDGVHIRLICAALEAVTRGEITHLLINLPPRYGKSNLVSILWPAWVWIAHPERRWLTASYGQPLAERHSTAMRRVIESPEYQTLFGDRFQLSLDVNQKARYENTRGGARIATSIGGGATGEGGEVLILDDAHKIEEVRSAAAREATIESFINTFSTRRNGGPHSAIVVVSQRLHQRDLAGHLIQSGQYVHLCLPAEYDPNHPYLNAYDPRTKPGEPLWPERYGSTALKEAKADLSAYAIAAQLQQLPAPAGGGLFLRKWWKWYDVMPARFDEVSISVDLSLKDSISSDYTVAQVWGTVGNDFYLLHQERQRANFPAQLALLRKIVRWVAEETSYREEPAVYIEDAATAAAVMPTLRDELRNLIPVRPIGSKETRAIAVSPTIEAGHVYLPGTPNAQGTDYDPSHTKLWVQQLLDECTAFPAAAYDDQVDALTQAIHKLTQRGPRLTVLTASW